MYYVRSRRRSAFTLVELLSVLVIIAILAALILGLGDLAKRKAREARCKAEIERMHTAIQNYQMKWGSLPPSLATIATNLPEGFMIVSNTPVDPWQRQYQYSSSGEASYRLYSFGPDMTNTADDIESGR